MEKNTIKFLRWKWSICGEALATLVMLWTLPHLKMLKKRYVICRVYIKSSWVFEQCSMLLLVQLVILAFGSYNTSAYLNKVYVTMLKLLELWGIPKRICNNYYEISRWGKLIKTNHGYSMQTNAKRIQERLEERKKTIIYKIFLKFSVKVLANV